MDVAQIERLKRALGDRYAFERELGEGAFATVFLARDLRLERPVAIKVLHVDSKSDQNEVRFLREIRFLASLQHPNIVPVHDTGHLDDLLYYVMPYVSGESLRERITRSGQLSIAEAIRITCEIGDAVESAHNAGIIHRDIKPENILLSGSHPMLADFGVARAINGHRSKRVTQTGGAPGTPAYMSPEQLLGDSDVDQRSDIYSLGCVLFEMLTGHAPFGGAAGLAKRVTEAAPSPRMSRPAVPVSLDKAVRTSLATDPEERFPSIADMCGALSAAGRDVHDYAPSTELSKLRGYRLRRVFDNLLRNSAQALRSRAGKLAVGLLIVAVFMGAARLMANSRRSGKPEPGDPRRVAVLDFQDQSPDHSLGHIASGLAVSLTQELAGVSALQVVSRNSVKSFETKGSTIDSLVSALRVGTLIEGTLQKSNDRLRLAVQVVDPESKTQLESATLERTMGELFLLEDDLAHQVAMILRRRLGVVVRVRETISGTTNARARDLVFRADKLREDAEPDVASPLEADALNAQFRLQSADSLLVLAERLDPNWVIPTVARGWVALSLAQSDREHSRAEYFRRAVEYANRALSRGAKEASALELRGTAYYWEVMRLDLPDVKSEDLLTRASDDLRRALAADSSLASAWGTLSLVLYSRGDVLAADRTARTALEMDTYLKDAPRMLVALFSSNVITGRFDEAAKWCSIGMRDYPRDSRFLDCELTLLAEKNGNKPDPVRAWTLVRHANEVDPPGHARAAGRPYMEAYRQMMLAAVLAKAGEQDSAEAIVTRMRAAVANDTSVAVDFLYDDAYLSLLLGKQANAIRLLSEYLAARPSVTSLLSRHQRWQPLWNDPRFIALVRRKKQA